MKKIIMMGVMLLVLSSCGNNIQQGNSSSVLDKKIYEKKLEKANIKMKNEMKNISEEILNEEISEKEALDKIVNSMEKSINK